MRLSSIAVFLCVVGCSSAPARNTSTDSGSTASDTADEVADTIDPIPCGKRVGDTLCDLTVQGYVRNEITGLATSVDPKTFKISEALAAGTQKYAFVFNTAWW